MAKPRIGFCGLGAMGFGMATHLVKTGYHVTGYDVHSPSVDRFVAAGGARSTSLASSAEDSSFYIVMVASAQQAQTALFAKNGIAKALPRGATLLLASTVPSNYAKSVEEELQSIGRADIFFIDAPVSGGADRSARGTLSVMASATPAALARGRWLLQEISAPSRLYIVEGGIGAGSNMKMAHQVLAAIHILAVSEAYGFGAKLGLEQEDIHHAVMNSQAWSWMFENRSRRTLKKDFSPGASAASIIAKDTGIITSVARSEGFPAALCFAAEQVYYSVIDRGWGQDDDAGIVRLWTSQLAVGFQGTISSEEKHVNLRMVIDLLTGIHLVATAEAISLAKQVGISLEQLCGLASEAAGSSTVFKRLASSFSAILAGHAESSNGTLAAVSEALRRAVDKAQTMRCPLYLGSAALSILLHAGSDVDLTSLLRFYRVL